MSVVEVCGVKLMFYFDDLLCLFFGLLCIVFMVDDYVVFFDVVFFFVNGMCYCMGSFGVCVDNDLLVIVCCFVECIYFVYLCVIKCEGDGCIFYESVYFEGDVDMVVVFKEFVVEDCKCDSVL